MDEYDGIQKANDIALAELEKIKTETEILENKAGQWIKTFIELLTNAMKSI